MGTAGRPSPAHASRAGQRPAVRQDDEPGQPRPRLRLRNRSARRTAGVLPAGRGSAVRGDRLRAILPAGFPEAEARDAEDRERRLAARPRAADQAQGRELRQHRARLGAARAGRHAGLQRLQRRRRGQPGEAGRQGVRPRRHAVEVPLPRVLGHQGRGRAAGLLARPRRPAAGRRQHLAQPARHLLVGSGRRRLGPARRPCAGRSLGTRRRLRLRLGLSRARRCCSRPSRTST